MSLPRDPRNNIGSLIEWMRYLNAIDEVIQARVGIDTFHHQTHEGNSYTYPFVDIDVDIAAPKYILLRTPDTLEEQHLTISVGADGVAEAELFENPTVNVVGAARTPINRNRRSTNASNVLMYEDPTIGLDNVQLAHMDFGAAGQGMRKLTGAASMRDEFILNRNEDYVIKVTVTADDTHVNIQPDWYEVTRV